MAFEYCNKNLKIPAVLENLAVIYTLTFFTNYTLPIFQGNWVVDSPENKKKMY